MEDYEKIELRSEKVRKIIGHIPPFLIRSGISFTAFIVGILMIGAWYIPYPETLRNPIQIICAQDQQILAIGYIPYSYVTHLQTGMSVETEWEGYNARKYGFIKGCIQSIDKKVIEKDGYNYFTVVIQLTSPHEKIEIKEQMKGEGFILISHKSIVNHLLDNIIK